MRRVVYGSSWDTTLPPLGNQPPTVHVASRDIAAHAELNAIRIACRAGLQRQLAGSTMYASGEPCPMCTGAILRFGMRRVVYGSSWDTMLPALGNLPPTVHVASRDIAALSPQEITVIGPCDSAL